MTRVHSIYACVYCYAILWEKLSYIEGSNNTQMNSKRPYKHILKNLFHEQATEIIPLLLPGYQVKKDLDVEIPDLKSTQLERPPGDQDHGLGGQCVPQAKV